MAHNKVICHCKNVDYIAIRQAMVKGAGTACGGCIPEIEKILASVCGCHNVSLEDVVTAVKNGADTVEKVAEVTKAGSACGRCQKLVANIIELGK